MRGQLPAARAVRCGHHVGRQRFHLLPLHCGLPLLLCKYCIAWHPLLSRHHVCGRRLHLRCVRGGLFLPRQRSCTGHPVPSGHLVYRFGRQLGRLHYLHYARTLLPVWHALAWPLVPSGRLWRGAGPGHLRMLWAMHARLFLCSWQHQLYASALPARHILPSRQRRAAAVPARHLQ